MIFGSYFIYHEMFGDVWIVCLQIINYKLCPHILKSCGIIYPHLQAYLEEVDKYEFQYFIFYKTTTPYRLKEEGMFRDIWIVHVNPLKWIVPLKPKLFRYLHMFLAYLDVSNSYKFLLVFHISQDFSWHMNCVCNHPSFVDWVLK